MPKHDTFSLFRAFSVTPATVFAAFANPEARAVWSPPSPDLNMSYVSADFRVGGRDLWRCGPGPAEGVEVETLYHAIQDPSLIQSTEVLRYGETVEGAALVTVTLVETSGGTDLSVLIQSTGLGDSDTPKEMQEGWQSALENLAGYLER